MKISGVEIEDTFAEAFDMHGTRIQVTAIDRDWARKAALEATGFATSIIECGCEAGIEREVSENESFDGRPGFNLLFFTMRRDGLEDQLTKRVGQSIMTAPSSACFNALESEENIVIGGKLRYFGDGYQISKLYGQRRLWRIPVMDGEFLIDESFGVTNSIGGGNFLILGEDQKSVVKAAERAVKAISEVEGVVLPFPGGVVRSGSKMKSKYEFLSASTNTAYCPSIKNQVKSNLTDEINSVLEIVLDGLSLEAIKKAMRVGIEAACGSGIVRISAGNYGGDLGAYNIDLHQLFRGENNE